MEAQPAEGLGSQELKIPMPDEADEIINNPEHEWNQKTMHEIIVDNELEQTKMFEDLDNASVLMQQLNKTQNLRKSFLRQTLKKDQLEQLEKEGKKCNFDKVYMNTRRNGFISAMAMCWNYHLPLILDPNDIWLAVLQGFRVHLMFRHNTSYITSTFKDLDKIPHSNEKWFKLNEANLGDI
jgi:hypothetical protein